MKTDALPEPTPELLAELDREITAYLASMDEVNSLAPHRLAAIRAYTVKA